MEQIKVAMCDNLEQICINIRNHFKYLEGFKFVGYCTDSQSVSELVETSRPDVLLLDIQFENGASGIDIIPNLLSIEPNLKIIMLTSYLENNYIFNAIINGASDYIVKSCGIDEIAQKIRDVYADTSTLSPEIFKRFNMKSQELATAHKI